VRRSLTRRKSGIGLDPEVRHLLATLEQGGFIDRDAEGCFRVEEDDPGAAKGPGTVIARWLVEAWLSEDWLERRGERLVLSDTGRARLRRAEREGDIFRRQHQLDTSKNPEGCH
jgi:hypothetical protein